MLSKIPTPLVTASLLISLQAFLLGYVFSCLNSCLVSGSRNDGSKCFVGSDLSCPRGTLYNDLLLTDSDAQLATSLVIVGAWIGSLTANVPAGIYGRKFTLLMNNIFFIAGTVACLVGGLNGIFCGRLVGGIGAGVSSSVAPILLSEIASDETKGILTALFQVVLTFAIFVAAIIAYGFVTFLDHGWMYVIAIGGLPALISLSCYRFIPESPKWLVTKNRLDEALSTLSSIRSKDTTADDIYKELQTMIKGDIEHNKDENNLSLESGALVKDATWTEVFKYKQPLIIGCGLMAFQTLSGIDSVTLYSSTTFQLAGFKESILGTAMFGITNFGATTVSASLVDKLGRKYLLLRGCYLMVFSLVVLSTTLLIDEIPEYIQGIVAVIAVLFYTTGFAIGLGAVCWAVISEIMPTRLRQKAASLFLSVNWLCDLMVGLFTLTAIDELGGIRDDGSMTDDEYKSGQKKGVAYLYLVFAGITSAAIWFFHFYLPETKGKTPEEIMNLLLEHQPLLLSEEES